MWKCQCSCENNTILIVSQHSLKTGNTQSCGCLQRDRATDVGKNNKQYNKYDLSGDYGVGFTKQNESFYFDLEDYDKIKNYCWYKDKDGYIVNKTDEKIIRMHRIVLSANDDQVVDHINHHREDNRKCNIRLCTIKENNRNTGIRKNNTSGQTGITYDKKYGCWRASITVDYKTIYLGSFSSEEKAIDARLKAEQEYFGEYAYSSSSKLANNY